MLHEKILKLTRSKPKKLRARTPHHRLPGSTRLDSKDCNNRRMIYEVTIDGKQYRVELHQSDSAWMCEVNGTKIPLNAILVSLNTLSLLINGKSYQIRQEQTPEETKIWVDG